jgi:uncharacterized Zn-binding protein involved in type VI secretion
MSGSVQRVGDRNTAGGIITNGDSSVLVNNRPVAVSGSRVTPHPCCGAKGCPPVHCSATTSSNNTNVLVNGIPIIVSGDLDSCNHTRSQGSFDVVVG